MREFICRYCTKKHETDVALRACERKCLDRRLTSRAANARFVAAMGWAAPKGSKA
ncbi:MAG TPA: hypothetical protein PLE61_15370 [Vicinamibacterales bacterium]|nr:hypothetical protein [Vicinamibacterales bacterium]